MLNLLLLLGIILLLAVAGYFFAPPSWRTIVGNVLMALPIVAGEIANGLTGFDWREILTPGQSSWVMLLIVVVNVIYRMKTTTPWGLPKDARPPRGGG